MQSAPNAEKMSGILGFIEWIGNKLPDPAILFVVATALVIALSVIGNAMGWSVQPVRIEAVADAGSADRAVKLVPSGEPPIRAKSILTGEGIYWLTANMVRNFINFAPLGIVLVSVMGIGVAERMGLFASLMKVVAGIVPNALLTPTVIFLGIMSHVASDAGYVVLPPLAATLFAMFGRPPIAGVAAAFAGVAGGFSANLIISSSDALIAPITEKGARVLEPAYAVAPTCNWYFMAASAIMLPLVGWWVTAKFVEPRAAAAGIDPGVPEEKATSLTPSERKGLWWALTAYVVVGGAIAAMFLPGMPLHGQMPAKAPTFGPIPAISPEGGTPADAQGRWTVAIVPMIFLVFLAPGIAYGVATGVVKGSSQVSDALVASMKQMAGVIVMCFFAAQFIECFKFSQLDRMLAFTGGTMIASAGLPSWIVIVVLIGLTAVINLFIASMSAKWTGLSPVVVPMMMMSGFSPELVQCAYRIGDSCTNVLTPLNAYMALILLAAQKYRKNFGLGSMISLMLPYSIAFMLAWTILLVVWSLAGWELGLNGPLWYRPQTAPSGQ